MRDLPSFRNYLWVMMQLVLLVLIASAPAMQRGGSPGWQKVLGGLMMGVSGLIGFAAVRALGRSTTPFPTPRPNARLVRSGIYRHIRHPMYTFLIIASAGWAIFWSSLLALGGWAGLMVFLRAKAQLEERLLRERFPEYAEYATHTGQFFPRIR